MYRSVKKSTNSNTSLERNTNRPPGNVPYLIDNLWEWARPEEFPNRRHSVYACPTVELAKELGPKDGTVYKINIEQSSFKMIAQLIDIKDSKYHDDCKDLLKLMIGVFKEINKNWIELPIDDKLFLGKLYIPCLSKEEVEEIMNSELLLPHKQAIIDNIKYWNNVKLVDLNQGFPSQNGEIFFEANQHVLESI